MREVSTVRVVERDQCLVMMEQILFSVFSSLTILSSLRVVRLPHPVHAVLSLIVAFVSASALMRLLQLEFE